MKDLILITCYCDTQEKRRILENLVDSFMLVKDKFDLMIVSHTTVSEDLIKKVDYFFYDKKNELLYDWGMRCMPWFNPGDERAILSIFTAEFNTHLAIWRMMILGNSLAKNAGYTKVHHIEYDCSIKDFSEILENNKSLDTYTAVVYNYKKENVDDILFGTYQAYRLDKLPQSFIDLNENFIKKMIRESDHKSPEKMLFDILQRSGNLLVKDKKLLDNNGNRFGISHDIVARNKTAWCLPFYDRSSDRLGFVVWNMEKEVRSIDVKVIYNNEKIYHSVVKPKHWWMADLGMYKDANQLVVILDGEVRNTFNFSEYREEFKKASFRQDFYR